MRPYERLAAWRHAHSLCLETYRLTATLPASERYGIVAQARRAAFSVASNIAEGYAKRGSAELRRYLDISLGSLSELSYCVILARDLGYLTNAQWLAFEKLRDEAGRTLWGLYRSVAKRAA